MFKCAACDIVAENLLQCKRCRNVYYCNKKCQKNNWSIHSKDCKVKHDLPTEEIDDFFDPSIINIPKIIPHQRICEYCLKSEPENERYSKCGKCKTARYCSVECQKHDWKVHKKICSVVGSFYDIETLFIIFLDKGVYYFTTEYINEYQILNFLNFFSTYADSMNLTESISKKFTNAKKIEQGVHSIKNKVLVKSALDIFGSLPKYYLTMEKDYHIRLLQKGTGPLYRIGAYDDWKNKIINFDIKAIISKLKDTYYKKGSIFLPIKDGVIQSELPGEKIDQILAEAVKSYVDLFTDIFAYIEKYDRQGYVCIDTIYYADSNNYYIYHYINDEDYNLEFIRGKIFF
jgi:hypothetical protein